MSDLFEFKHVRDDEPLRHDPFHTWLTANVSRADPGRGLDLIVTYLSTLGYVRGEHRISEEAIKTLRYVIDMWLTLTPFGEPATLSELFDDSTPRYYVIGLPQRADITPAHYAKGLHRRADITPKLKTLVECSGWIYEVSPDTTYFEIIEDRLYAKYQQILGSRFLCRIREEKT